MREGRKRILQAKETSYFLHSLYEPGFHEPFKWEKERCVRYAFKSKANYSFFFIVTDYHSSKSVIKTNKLHSYN